MTKQLLKKAKEGDIKAFHILYSKFQPQLKSYLYRLLTDRNEVEDLVQDLFVKAFDKLKSFQEKSSLKTWVFTIATRMAYDKLKDKSRWSTNIFEKAKEFAHSNENVLGKIKKTSTYSLFDIREHVDFCFTCISKTIYLEQQVVLILKDIYEFKVKEIALIINKTVPAVKHILRFARQNMIRIFDNKCSLINKRGTCHQCSELNGALNPEQKSQEALVRKELNSKKNINSIELLKLRGALAKSINPLKIEGTELHDIFMQINKKVEGEIEAINFDNK